MFIGFRNGEIVTRTAKEKRLKPTIKDTSKKYKKGSNKNERKRKNL